MLYSRKEKEYIDPAAITEGNRQKYHAFLHTNYYKFFPDLLDIVEISESFSLIDSIPWSVMIDHHWHEAHSAIPERAISFLSNKNGNNQRTFYHFEAPPRDRHLKGLFGKLVEKIEE